MSKNILKRSLVILPLFLPLLTHIGKKVHVRPRAAGRPAPSASVVIVVAVAAPGLVIVAAVLQHAGSPVATRPDQWNELVGWIRSLECACC